jgi:hypothetical protein
MTDSKKELELRSSTGKILFLDEIKSIRSVCVNNLNDSKNFFKVDVVDVSGIFLQDYTCSFECLNIICAMLYAEGDTEDKTIVTMSFEAIVSILAMSKNLGYIEANQGTLNDEHKEPFFKEPNMILN